MSDRSAQVTTVVRSLEEGLELLCITGVEDQLQVSKSGLDCTGFVQDMLNDNFSCLFSVMYGPL